MTGNGVVVVFDFDKTIIDCDSDNWVINQLGATDLFNRLLPNMPWNPLMDKMMGEIHSQGKSVDDVAEVLKRTPIHPRTVAAIRSAHALRCDLRIISDANSFFIETVLRHHGIRDCFTEINTNPSFVDGEGRLRISPHHDSISTSASPHGCGLCPPNMCKGVVMDRLQASASGKKKIIYLGDGSGDFCPSLRLRGVDFVMPRKGFPLWDLICGSRKSVAAEVREWCDGGELESVLLRLIDGLISAAEGSSSVADGGGLPLSAGDFCGLQTIPAVSAAPEALPVPVRVLD